MSILVCIAAGSSRREQGLPVEVSTKCTTLAEVTVGYMHLDL